MQDSQHSRILKVLRKQGGKGVPNYRFPEMYILSYTKRIQELRRDGHNITSERQWHKGHATGVWVYTLIEEAE